MRRRKDDEIFTSYVARLLTEICQTRTYSRTLMMINVLNDGIIFSRIVNCFCALLSLRSKIVSFNDVIMQIL